MTGTLAPVARSTRERAALAGFWLLAFGVTWVVWVPRALESTGALDSRWAAGLGAGWGYGSAMAAVLTASWVGRPAMRELGSRLTRWRVGVRWWAVVLAGPAVLWLATAGLYGVLGGDGSQVRPQAIEAGAAGVPPPVP